MNHRELEYKFIDFLLSEKGYTKKNLLLEASLSNSTSKNNQAKRYIADLILLDTAYNNYLALVEFKSYKNPNQARSSDVIAQVQTYLDIIGNPNLPGYLVTTNPENDFCIFILDNNDWREIEKDDFPHYDSLSSKNQADERKLYQEITKEKAQEIKKKRDIFRSTALSTLMSLIVGLVSVFILSKKVFFTASNDLEDEIKVESYNSLLEKTSRIESEITEIEKELLALKTQDSVLVRNSDNIKLNLLNDRILTMENIFTQSPERILKLQELTFELKNINDNISKEREISEIKIVNLKERMDQLTLWTSGLIITILGSIIGFAINAFRK